jgi:DNA-binding protein H-NS
MLLLSFLHFIVQVEPTNSVNSTKYPKEKMDNLIEIQAQIKALQTQAEEIKLAEFTNVIKDIKEKMQAYGITIKDLSPSGKSTRKAASGDVKAAKPAKKDKDSRSYPAVEIKYRGPAGQTWTGRGLKPRWLEQLISEGNPKEKYLVTPDTSIFKAAHNELSDTKDVNDAVVVKESIDQSDVVAA